MREYKKPISYYFRGEWPYRILFALLLVVFLFSNYRWLKEVSPNVVGTNAMNMHVSAMQVNRSFLNHETVFVSPAIFTRAYRGPVLFYAAAFFAWVFGASHMAYAFTNSLFCVLLLLAVFAIGKRFSNGWGGLLAAFLTLSAPKVLLGSRSFTLEISMAAMVAAAAYLLLRSLYFRRAGFSLLFGLFAGLALLSKAVAFVFIIPLIIGAIWQEISRRKNIQKRGDELPSRLRWAFNVVLALGVTTLITVLWYWNRLLLTCAEIWSHVVGFWKEYTPLVDGHAEFQFVPFHEQILFGLGPLFFLMCIYVLVRPLLTKYNLPKLVYLWALVPALVFLTGPAEYVRFLVPAIPAFAILAAQPLTLSQSPHRWPARIVVVLLVLCGAIQIGCLTQICDYRQHTALVGIFDWKNRTPVMVAVTRAVGENKEPKITVLDRCDSPFRGAKVYYHLGLHYPAAELEYGCMVSGTGHSSVKFFSGRKEETNPDVLVLCDEKIKPPSLGRLLASLHMGRRGRVDDNLFDEVEAYKKGIKIPPTDRDLFITVWGRK